MNELKPAATFGACLSGMFLHRIADRDTFTPLHALKAYQEAHTAYSTLHSELFDQDRSTDKSTVQAIINALHRIQDLEMEYIYRLGIHEGIRISKPEFLTEGIGLVG